MPCTTILVGKKASYDGSTLIARNDDAPSGQFTAKKLIVVEPKDQPRHYKSVIAHLAIELPDNPLRYTATPNVDPKDGVWAAGGINAANVAMTATETITSNPRVLGADPLVCYQAKTDTTPEKAGGIGEEDLVVIVLPYIHSAREGVLRLGSLLEKYGTYETNGIAFSDKDEIWWLESIGGHHWIAKKVPDDRYVAMPNWFGLDTFDWDDAYGEKKENLCSADLKEFVAKAHLDLTLEGKFSPRVAFGSHDDSDHVYNTPRSWIIERYLNPHTFKWEGDHPDFTPEADDIPWSLKPERKITVEDVKYLLAEHFQGTEYDCYGRFGDLANKGRYRPIGISRTCDMAILQIRGYAPAEIAGVEWACFGCNVFNAAVPQYANVPSIPAFLSNATLHCDTNNLYWNSRLLAALADAHFNTCSIHIERYQNAVANKGHELINKYDGLIAQGKATPAEANEAIAAMAKTETQSALDKVLYEASCHMKNGYSRSDN